MDYAYRYGDPSRLYLNVTNRCTNRCAFCVRYAVDGLGDGSLWGGPEPDLPALLAAVDARAAGIPLREIVWCGFGEPTYRLDLISAGSAHLRARGTTLRLNTNGHACLIHGRDVLPELAASVDEVSVSLNAPDCARYLELCRPDLAHPEEGWNAVLDFLRLARGRFRRLQASVVGATLTGEEIDATRALALSLGVDSFRVR